ncbi:unnamed protein product [Ectocarpus sp. CCAP 1310/34]|nr:unnamed protein product [Ectocarpus sp. CCAP 1310/34]
MKANKTLTYLDLSHNLIGSQVLIRHVPVDFVQESINYVRPEFYTGAEALADWVSTGSCPLKYLDVSWNTIRLDSAVYFGNAVACETLRTWSEHHYRNDMNRLWKSIDKY